MRGGAVDFSLSVPPGSADHFRKKSSAPRVRASPRPSVRPPRDPAPLRHPQTQGYLCGAANASRTSLARGTRARARDHSVRRSASAQRAGENTGASGEPPDGFDGPREPVVVVDRVQERFFDRRAQRRKRRPSDQKHAGDQGLRHVYEGQPPARCARARGAH